MSRIELTDNIQDIVIKMADGNPGAVMALVELIQNNERIDPESMLGPFGAIMYLDSNEIYGSDIYVLFSDKCDKNIRKFIMLLRASQLGKFFVNRLKDMSLDQMYKLNIEPEEWDKIESDVLESLPEFSKE